METGQVVLADGRTLAYQDGEPGGVPVVLFHGAPGSRTFRPPEHQTRAAGVRLVTFDRPGYGGSTAREGRTVLDAVPDVAALADVLQVDRFVAVAWSGGGPFAVATAFALPERVRRLVLVSAPGPLDEVPGGWEALGEYRRPTAEMARVDAARSVRSVTRHMAPFLAEPVAFLGAGRGPDGLVMADPALRSMLEAQVRLALCQGASGIAADLVAMWLDWGFRLSDVHVPTAVFHGAADRSNGEDAQVYAARIPGATLTVWPDAGHLGLLAHWLEVLVAASG
ncbi:MAG: alpha/beta hydrolase [Actinobacteria bacterium]|nr:alpha/beta hydrolase [Actinomycetota bacterium]